MSKGKENGMTVSCRLEGGIIVNQVEGSVDPETTIAFVKANVGSWGQQNVLWDLSQARLGDVSVADCASLLASTEDSVKGRRGRRAALVSRQDLHGALLSFLSSMARRRDHPVELKAFTNHAAARAWLSEKQ